jgi:hypothetical protein
MLQSPGLGEGVEAAVESFLDLVGETAAGQLLYRQMIAYTLAAHSLFIAARIGAITVFQILLLFTLHIQMSPFENGVICLIGRGIL